jgi:integrase
MKLESGAMKRPRDAATPGAMAQEDRSPMQGKTTRRTYGTGSILIRGGKYHGKWRVGDRQMMRRLGPVRKPGTREGLTKAQAEARLRKLMDEVTWVSPEERLDFAEVAERYVDHLEHVMGRKPSTINDYRSMVRRHLGPYFNGKAIDRISADDVASYLSAKSRQGLSVKTVSNHLVFAHGVFTFAVKRGHATTNPVAAVDRPHPDGTHPDFRYLGPEEFEAVLRVAPNDVLGPTDRVVYLAAGMTGLRQGELIALRWRDIDWEAGLIRVRRNYTRSQFGTPKSRRSSRAVPMADRLAAELERHFQRSSFQADDDLVAPHPLTGHPYDASKMRKRFYVAMRKAGLGELIGQKNGITFHSLRHTYGTRMASVGTPMRMLQEWMGHRTVQTTEIYADYLPDHALGRSLTERAFGVPKNVGQSASKNVGRWGRDEAVASSAVGRLRASSRPLIL